MMDEAVDSVYRSSSSIGLNACGALEANFSDRQTHSICGIINIACEENSSQSDDLHEKSCPTTMDSQQLSLNKKSDISMYNLFLLFLYFGIKTYGDGLSHVALFKKEWVLKRNWIDWKEFANICQIYRILPGSQGLYMVGYMGRRMHGALGCFLAMSGFIFPGLINMLAASLIYHYEPQFIQSKYIRASFTGLQVAIIAILMHSLYRMTEDLVCQPFLKDQVGLQSNSQMDVRSQYDYYAIILIHIAAILYLMQLFVPFIFMFIAILSILLRSELLSKRVARIAVLILLAIFVMLYITVVHYKNNHMNFGYVFKESPMVARSLWSAFCLGIVAGLLTFGDALTSLFFVKTFAVTIGSWLSVSQFLDTIILAFLVPGSNVVYVLFIGSMGCGIAGGLLMLLGMLVPNVLVVILRHDILEDFMRKRMFRATLEGFLISLLGILSITLLQLVQLVLTNTTAVFIMGICLLVLLAYGKTVIYITPILLIATAIVGQVFYV